MVLIKEVYKGSYADKAGIKSGDTLVSVNSHEIRDVLDYRYRTCAKILEIEYITDSETRVARILKNDEYDDIGLDFETYLMDEKQTCKNKCIFCFIDQNPPGMRDSIYFKDDDSRLSFLMGNYVTLTNMTDADIDRIIEMKMSPVNISVHTMNPELRVKMMKNKHSGEVLGYIDRLADAGIELNFQIVLCKGLNDGDELVKTLDDLAELFPSVESVAVVPSGLTKYREGLYPLEDFEKEDAREVIKLVNSKRKEFEKKLGHTIVQCSDEWYLKAGIELPEENYYEGYPQLDNGVGLIRCQEAETLFRIDELLEEGFKLDKPRTVCSVTGRAAYDFISRMAKKLEESFEGLTFNVYMAENEFFGHTVTVAGLLTGIDIYNRLRVEKLAEELLIPSVMLRHEGDLFLDNMSVEELSEKLNVKIITTLCDGDDFVNKVLGIL